MKHNTIHHKYFVEKKLFAVIVAALPIFWLCGYVNAEEIDLNVSPSGAPLHIDPIHIGIIGDQTGAADLAAAYGYLQNGVGVLSTKGLDVVIHVGDLLESSQSEEEIASQYSLATGILDSLPVSWFMTGGDHDVNPPYYAQDSSDRSRETLFKTLYGERVPEVIDHLYYSFDVNGYHFISLYTLEALYSDPRWGNIFINQISDEQFNWLKGNLAAHAGSKGIIVFLHHPIWYNWSAWQRVHKLLSKYGVSTVISGHFHYDQRDMKVDGIRYLVVGATGGDVKQGSRDAGNVHHVSTMTVRGSSVRDFQMYSLSDSEPLELTPRVEMDKIQAMDVVLGELWNFASANPVLIDGGQLVNDCGSSEPARVSITPIGNPTDKTITVEIAFISSDGSVGIESAGFVNDQCDVVIDEYSCEMARSSRIFISNNSSVYVNPYAGPLWEAVLDGGDSPTEGTVLYFDIKLTYPANSGDLYLERRVSTTVGLCT